MKYRSDFVTNSSSSAFIVTFDNKESMERAKKEMLRTYSVAVVNEIFNDIENNRMTYSKIKEYYKEELKWIAYFEICYNSHEYRNMPYEWRKSAEYKKLEKEYIQKKMDYFEKVVNHRGIFSVIEYADETDFGSTMEHNIVPSLPFVFTSISHH